MSDLQGRPALSQEDILNMDDSKLGEAKLWLFKENMRLLNLQKELEEKSQVLEKEEESLRKELKDEMKKLQVFESQLILQKKHLDDRLHILQRGFEELNADRAMFESKQRAEANRVEDLKVDGLVFFRGVNSKQKLKKRYKDLLKIFHPDNSAGDEDTVLAIKSEYEELLDRFS